MATGIEINLNELFKDVFSGSLEEDAAPATS